MALSKFKLANTFPNRVLITIFHKRLISSPVRLKKIKTCHKNCNILIAYIKIHSGTMSYQNDYE